MNLINKKTFVKVALNVNIEVFVVYVISILIIIIYLTRKALIALMLTKKFKIPFEYTNFIDIFLEEKILLLLELTELNQYIIKLQDSK